MSVTDDIKARIDIVELISPLVKLRKSGRNFMGLCPFHTHKNNTPSFAVWPETGTWRCFGQCNEGGDIFKFVMKRDGVDFAEALRTLAAQAGIELKPRTPEEIRQDDNLNHLRQVLESAAVYYHHLLKNAPQAGPAREHLARRGLTDKTIEMFQLGYALNEWEAGLKYFTSRDYSTQDLLDAGLIVEKESASDEAGPSSIVVRHFDRFRDRLMIPVRDEQGRMTGFQARALQPDAAPKFMNSPQTALFDKGRTLFGLNLARKAIREQNAAIVVEGNLDVVAAHQAGFGNVVSSQGTALTEHQLRLLKKYSRRIVLALDADEAGDAATLRGLMVAREALDREGEITFDPRGLVKVEGRLGADIRVMTLPPGLDPDDVIKESPDEWKRLAGAAEPVVEYVIRVLTTGRNVDDPKVKRDVADAVLPVIEDVADSIERDAYRQKLARVLRMDERTLAARRPAAKPAARRPASVEAPAPTTPVLKTPESEATRLESFCLGALLREPDLLYKIDRELQGLDLAKLQAEDFANTEQQLLFHALAPALEQVDVEPSAYLRDNLDPTLQTRLDALIDLQPLSEADLSASAVLNAVLRLRRRNLSQQLMQLRFLVEDASAQDAAPLEMYQVEISQYAAALARVDRALAPRARRAEAPRAESKM
jgi:DNA primase